MAGVRVDWSAEALASPHPRSLPAPFCVGKWSNGSGAAPPWARCPRGDHGGSPRQKLGAFLQVQFGVMEVATGLAGRLSPALAPPRLNVVRHLCNVCSTFVQGLFNVCRMSIGSVTQLRPSLPQRSPRARARRRKPSGRAAGARRMLGRGSRDEAAPARCPRAACPTVSPTAPPTVASALPLRQGAARSLLVVEPILREVAPRATICCLRSKPV